MMARHALRLYRRLILRLYDKRMCSLVIPFQTCLSYSPRGRDDENPHGKACGPPC